MQQTGAPQAAARLTEYQPATIICAAYRAAVAELYQKLTEGRTAYYDGPPHSQWAATGERWHSDFRFDEPGLGQELHICADGNHNPEIGVTHILVTTPGHLPRTVVRTWLMDLRVDSAEFAVEHIQSNLFTNSGGVS